MQAILQAILIVPVDDIVVLPLASSHKLCLLSQRAVSSQRRSIGVLIDTVAQPGATCYVFSGTSGGCIHVALVLLLLSCREDRLFRWFQAPMVNVVRGIHRLVSHNLRNRRAVINLSRVRSGSSGHDLRRVNTQSNMLRVVNLGML